MNGPRTQANAQFSSVHVRANAEEWYTDAGSCARGQYELLRSMRVLHVVSGHNITRV